MKIWKQGDEIPEEGELFTTAGSTTIYIVEDGKSKVYDEPIPPSDQQIALHEQIAEDAQRKFDDDFTRLVLNAMPDPRTLKVEADGYAHYAIDTLRDMADIVFAGRWSIESLNVVIGERKAGQYIMAASCQLSVVYPSGTIRKFSGAATVSANGMKSGQLTAAETAKVLAEKQALKSIGKFFGRDLGKDSQDIDTRTAQELAQEKNKDLSKL